MNCSECDKIIVERDYWKKRALRLKALIDRLDLDEVDFGGEWFFEFKDDAEEIMKG